MASLLESAIRNVLRPATKSLAGVTVFYEQDGTRYGPIIATVGNTATEEETVDGFGVTSRLQEFKINVDDLEVIPKRLDIVVWQSSQDESVFTYWQVLSPGGSRAVDSFDNFQLVYRLQSRKISPPAVTLKAYSSSSGDAYATMNDDAYGGP